MNLIRRVLVSLWILIFLMCFSIPGLATEDKTAKLFRDLGTQWASAHPVQPQALIEPEKVMVPMRDGVKLSTSIFKSPFSFGPKPVILVRTPYNKESLDIASFLLALINYVIVTQDTRGRFASEGEDRVFQDDGWGEKQDGYDTIEWAAQQSWCNGKVGTYGPSALGIAQGLAAGAVPPHLVCQLISYTPAKGFGDIAYQGGVLRKSLVEGWLTSNKSEFMIPIFEAHTTNDAFWSGYDISSKRTAVKVPALFIGGWYDVFEQGLIDNFTGRQYEGGEGARGKQRLIMGPWTHVNQLSAKQGQLTYPLNSVHTDEIMLTLDWFDYWLRDVKNTVMDGPAVKYYVMGDPGNTASAGNKWKTSTDWPPFHTNVPFYLNANNELALTSPAQAEQTSEISFQPGNPVPTKGGMNLESNSGPYNQSELEKRSDMLVFTTSVLDKPIEVVGRVKAVIYASSNLTDTDISVRLTDVYPDGRSMLVCDGILRASFRESDTNPSPIEPGKIYPYEVDLWSTSIAFEKGHRIRVAVTNTNYPRFGLNPLYSQLKSGESAAVKIYFDKEHPSYILLPTESLGTSVDHWQIQ